MKEMMGLAEVDIELSNNERINGVFLKFEPPERLIHAIHTVVQGNPWFSFSLLKKLLHHQRQISNTHSSQLPVKRVLQIGGEYAGYGRLPSHKTELNLIASCQIRQITFPIVARNLPNLALFDYSMKLH